MEAAADLGRQGPRMQLDRGIHGDNPQVRALQRLPPFLDPDATTGREMMGHAGLTAGLEAIGKAFRLAASIVLGQAENRLHDIKAILLAILGR